MGAERIASDLSVPGLMPVDVMVWPRYSTSDAPKMHFVRLRRGVRFFSEIYFAGDRVEDEAAWGDDVHSNN
jgi:hypothetical protein